MALAKPALLCLALAATLLTGCSQPDPTGQPTYLCTPSDGSTPYSCYQVQYDVQVKEDKLYAEAETVYRKFLAEDERIHRVGGVTEPTPVLLETTTGNFAENAMTNFRTLKEAQATAVGGEFKIAWFKREPRDSLDGSIAALTVCTDTSSVQMGSKGKAPKPGLIIETTGYFIRVGEQLKLTASMFKEVTKC